ncbi:MAG TPA: hypothetical protein VJ227_04680 [Patescibacteria group bacterium]|nr:hypothetical protein [Patescibacteria group bacterium]
MFATALVGTLICMLFLVLPLFFVADKARENFGWVGRWVAGMFIVTLVVNILYVYLALPPMVGPLGGYQWFWFMLLINAVITGFYAMMHIDAGRYREADTGYIAGASAIASGIGILAIGLVWMLIAIFTTWGSPNAKALAAYPQLTVSESPYPEADTNHTVIVSEAIARFKGGQVIAASGENLGSRYHAEDYTLLSVRGHMYYVAALVYNNVFANLENPESPGLVVVDAEDPNVDARLSMEHKLRYIPWALFNQDLSRHIYLSGYDGYRLIDPTLEVDDEWRPYFTVDVSSYVRGVTGIKVEGVLLVDSQTGEITRYEIGKEPVWVDRVIPASAVEEYIYWWGKWHAAPWFNLSGRDAEESASDMPALVYNRADGYPAWQFVMTSSSSMDHSSTKVILFDTKLNRGTIYTKDSGLAVPPDVTHAFASNPGNIKNYEVAEPVLFNFFGRLTWMTTFQSPASDPSKATFQAVGLMDAKSIQGANVVMETSKEEALRVYQRWLADHGENVTGSTQVVAVKEIEGYVDRFGVDTQDGTTTYYLTLKDMDGNLVERIFFAALTNDTEKLPLTQLGDHVVIRYEDVNTRQTAMKVFNNVDVAVPLIDPTTGAPWDTAIPTPTPTPTPTATPTATSLPLFETTPTP